MDSGLRTTNYELQITNRKLAHNMNFKIQIKFHDSNPLTFHVMISI